MRNTIRALLNDKVANHQKDLITRNVYVHRNRASNYVKQKLTELEEEIEKNQNDSWEFNTLLLIIERQNISKIIEDVN